MKVSKKASRRLPKFGPRLACSVLLLLPGYMAARNLLIIMYNTGSIFSKRLNVVDSCTPVRVGGNPGNDWYGSWWLCDEELQGKGRTMISFGSGCDSTFEWDFLLSSPTSDCHIMDPTIAMDMFWGCSNTSQQIVAKGAPFPQTNTPQFWPLGLSDTSRVVQFSKSSDPKIGSLTELEPEGYSQSSVHGIVFDLHMAYALLGIKTQPILKMDIEGSEFEVIASWCAFGMPYLKPTQVLVEFHQRFLDDGVKKRDRAIDCLTRLGYQKVFDHNEEEYLFVLKS